ncbi:MAG: homoserine kinase [Candidatus Bathyarchaeia archaeon]
MKLSHVEAIAPATSANLGAGFDVLGVALNILFDKVSVDVTAETNIKIYVKGKGAQFIPTDPNKNTAGIVAKALLDYSSEKCGLTINIEKGIRPGSGLGSSAASAAATALAVNEALQLGFSRNELIKFAALGEKASAGAPHADNVSAALLGFFTAIISHDPLEVIQLPAPNNAKFIITLPEMVLSTSLARSVLPEHVKRSDAIYNVAHVCAFIAGVATGDIALMGKGMKDLIAEPYRAKLIPGLADVKKNAVEAGAEGVTISGAGPAIIALIDSEKQVEKQVMKAMKEGFEKNGIKCEVMLASPGPGAKIVGSE